ncbi:MAG: MBL fold metallo-hydrolase [Candidatus Paceibacterota bacterium]|jgi:competence protein ComEC
MSKNSTVLLVIFLAVFDAFVWWQIIFNAPQKDKSDIYFLNVGQGDGELAVLDGNIKVLIDGGPNNSVPGELDKGLRSTDRYIDLVVLSHPQTDHFMGLVDVFKRYNVGAFIFSGRETENASFKELENIIKRRNVQVVILEEGDRIKHLQEEFVVLAPDKNSLESSNVNDTTLVLQLISQKLKILFTGDAEGNIEKDLVAKYGNNLRSDILKVAHHGSKYSSSDDFLRIIDPKISVIEVGKNSYGHPTPETLSRLANVGSQIFTTLQNGTVRVTLKDGKVYVFVRKK